MANSFPLILNSSNVFAELAAGDNLDLTNSNVVGVIDVTAAGNISAGNFTASNSISAGSNISATGNISASYFLGNIRDTTGGYSNANVNSYLPVYTGNIQAGNVSINESLYLRTGVASYAILRGNASAGTWSQFILPTSNGVANNVLINAGDGQAAWANITTPPGGSNTNIQFNLNGGFAGSNALSFDLASNLLSVTGSFVTTSANVQGNLQAGNVQAAGTVIAPTFQGNLQGNVSGNLTGNVVADLVNTQQLIVGDGGATFGNSNVTLGDSNITLAVSQSNVYARNFIGNVIGNISGNITVVGANTQVLFNSNGLVGAAPTFTFDYQSNTVAVGNAVVAQQFIGNLIGNSVGSHTGAVTGNVTAPVISAGNVTAGNISLGSNIRILGDVNEITANTFRGTFIGNITGNLTVTGDSSGVVFKDPDTGAANAVLGFTYDKGNSNVAVAGNVAVTANIAADYFLGNGRFLTGLPEAYTNANVANYLVVYGGNILANEITANLVVANTQGLHIGNVSGNLNGNSYGIHTGNVLGNVTGATATFSGNVTGSYWLGNLVGNTVSAANSIFTNGNITAAGAVINGNLSTSNASILRGITAVTGGFAETVTANNITATNVVTASEFRGNILGNLIGNSYGSHFGPVTGNISGNITGNVTGNLIGNSYGTHFGPVIGDVTGNISGTTATFSGNVTGGNISAAGEVSGGTGSFGNTSISNLTVTGESTFAANVVMQGNLRVLGNITTINADSLAIANLQVIVAANAAQPSDANGAGLYVAGANTGWLYNSVENAWVANIDLETNSNVDANNFNATNGFYGQLITVAGNATVGNINSLGNVTGSYILGNGRFLTGLPEAYSNANVENFLGSNSNIDITIGTANINTQGNISAGLGNVYAGNIIASSLYGNLALTQLVVQDVTNYSGNLTALPASGILNVRVAGNFRVTPGPDVLTALTTGSAADINAVVQGNGVYVAVGSGSTILTSTDGITWTQRTAPAGSYELVAVDYNPSNDVFAIQAAEGTAIAVYHTTSTNLATWTRAVPNATPYSAAPLLTYSAVADAFIITTSSSTWYSADAATWSSFFNNGIAPLGSYSSDAITVIYNNSALDYSTDPTSVFYTGGYSLSGTKTSLEFANGVWVLGSTNGSIRTTFDITNSSGWQTRTTNTTDDILQVWFTNGLWYAATGTLGSATTGMLISADNGITWQPAIAQNSAAVNTAAGITVNGTPTVLFLGDAGLAMQALPGGGAVDLGAVRDLRITGGASGQLLQTDGTGNLAFANAYSNADIAAYLPVYSGNLGNGQGYVFGNGAFLTGLPEAYGNANVANYLPTYTGNITAGNATVSGNITAGYFLGNGALLTGIAAGYGNSNVADFLASNSNVNISIGTGNLALQGTANLGSVSNVKIFGGSTGQVLSTDGAGNLTWATGGGGGGSNATAYNLTFGSDVTLASLPVNETLIIEVNYYWTQTSNSQASQFGKLLIGPAGSDAYISQYGVGGSNVSDAVIFTADIVGGSIVVSANAVSAAASCNLRARITTTTNP